MSFLRFFIDFFFKSDIISYVYIISQWVDYKKFRALSTRKSANHFL